MLAFWLLVSLWTSFPVWSDQTSATPSLFISATTRCSPSGLSIALSNGAPLMAPIRLRVARSHDSQSLVVMLLLLNAIAAGFCGETTTSPKPKRVGTTKLKVGAIFAGFGSGSGVTVHFGVGW